MSSALLEMQRSIENEYEKRIEEILVPVVGLGKVRAKVAAEVDQARVNTTEETFDPDKATVRSSVKNEENTQGSKPNPVGIPGSRSNLPGAEAQNPPLPMANTSSDKNISNTTYAIPRKVQTVDKPSGGIKRLTVAVIVDGNYKTVGTTDTFIPRSEEELRRIQELVGNAVGYDSQRRDSITVSSLPFRNTEVIPEDVVPEIPWWKKGYNPMGLLGLGISLLFSLLLFLRRQLTGNSESDLQLPRTIAELEAEGAEGSAKKDNSLDFPEDTEPFEKLEEMELKKRILEKLSASPKKGFAVLSEWMEEENTLYPPDKKKELIPAYE
jgi:flagellar M-ring protein FliF